MSSPNLPPSPLAEALANEDISFTSPEALRTLPIGSSWPGPRLPSKIAPPSRKEKRKSKLLPGEKDPQPPFRLPTASTPSRCHSTAAEQAQSPPSGIAGPSQPHDPAALRSPTALSSVMAGSFRRCSATIAAVASADRSKQLSPASGPRRRHNVVTANHGQSTVQGDAQPKNKEKGEERTESLNCWGSIDPRPLHRGASWPDSQPPSSSSSSGSWLTARGEDFREVGKDRENSTQREAEEEGWCCVG